MEFQSWGTRILSILCQVPAGPPVGVLSISSTEISQLQQDGNAKTLVVANQLEYGVHCQEPCSLVRPGTHPRVSISICCILWFPPLGLSSLLPFATGTFDLFLFNPSAMEVVL